MLKSTLIILGILCVIFCPLVTAEDFTTDQENSEATLLKFSISHFTNNFPSGTENIGLDSLSGAKEEILDTPEAVKKYELVTFDQVGLNNNIRSFSSQISFQINGTEYLADLKRMDFESIDDGIDSYSGMLTGEANSAVLLTICDNATIGSITLNDETFYIEPVQIKSSNQITERIPHIIYSSKDVEKREFLIDNGPINSQDNELGVGYQSLTTNSGIDNVQQMDSVPDGRTVVTVLIVTDNQFYSDHSGSGWKVIAQDIIAEANRQFGREDIGVILVPDYDDSKRQDLTNQPLIRSNPFVAFGEIYPDASLNEKSADLGLYLGGYDKTTGQEQGLSDGFGNVSYQQHGRHSWAQMVEDESDHLYPGTTEARRVVTIHELGHQFGAHHDDGDHELKPEIDTPGYNRATSWPLVPAHGTVMWHWYIQGFNTYEFSSSWPNHHGDPDHDNARRIRETKATVSGYAGCSASLPSADFYWSPDISPLYTGQIIRFIPTNELNSPTYHYWNLGDGTLSSEIEPEWVYLVADDYQIKLTVANCAGSSTTEHIISISESPHHTSFEGNPLNGDAPLTVRFNASANPPAESWNWSFGDGEFSESANPEHTYERAGSYTVTLNATQDGVPNTNIKPNYIDVSPTPPHADFSATPLRSGTTPATVVFNDTSTNDPDRWSWNFGDGSSSTLQNPSHTYLANGTYSASLTATNSITGSKTTEKTNYITVGPLYATTAGAYTILKFNSTGSTKWTPPFGVTSVDYLVVGGGGQGGIGALYTYDHSYLISGGGGGAGGILNGSARPVVGAQTIVVGAGGSGSTSTCGAKGGDSSFGNASFNIFVHGGGGGAGGGNYCDATKNGGSGGGGTGDWFVNPNGTGIAPEGYDGGAGYLNSGLYRGDGGGGGGVAAKGSAANSTSGGDGGSGKLYYITGEPVPFGGGGGGGSAMYGTTYGSGGFGCGGDGSKGEPNNAKCEETGAGGGGTSGTTRGSGMLSGAGGSGVVIIWYKTPVVAGFTAIPTSGTAPLTVLFTDTSTGNPTGRIWDFGDGDATNASEQHPVHTYKSDGSFNVSLTVTNPGGNNSTTKMRYINVGMQDMVGVFRNSTSKFILNNGSERTVVSWGLSTDMPVAGDWNGDGMDDVGVFRPSAHNFILNNGTERTVVSWGQSTDIPVAGKWS